MKIKHTSKIFALLLAILMVVAILPFAAITALAEDSGDLVITELEITLENYLAGYTVGDVVITDNSDLTDDNEYGWIDENGDGDLENISGQKGSTPYVFTKTRELLTDLDYYELVISVVPYDSMTDMSGLTAEKITVKGATVIDKKFETVTSGEYIYYYIDLKLASPALRVVENVDLEL